MATTGREFLGRCWASLALLSSPGSLRAPMFGYPAPTSLGLFEPEDTLVNDQTLPTAAQNYSTQPPQMLVLNQTDLVVKFLSDLPCLHCIFILLTIARPLSYVIDTQALSASSSGNESMSTLSSS
jgi:hypothetical protein